MLVDIILLASSFFNIRPKLVGLRNITIFATTSSLLYLTSSLLYLSVKMKFLRLRNMAVAGATIGAFCLAPKAFCNENNRTIHQNSQKKFLNNEDYDKLRKDNLYDVYSTGIENEDGDTLAEIGAIYYFKKNYDDMKKYLSIAIEKGNTNAMATLGIYYMEDTDKTDVGMNYLETAVLKGNPSAMTYLGLYYYDEEEKEKSLKYLKMAAEKHDLNGLYYLGLYYMENGEEDEGEFYICSAADHGHHEANVYIARKLLAFCSERGIAYNVGINFTPKE